MFPYVDGRIKFNLDHVREPSTEEEIKSIVKDAYLHNRKIRVLGSGHSWSEVAQSTDIMISLNNYTGLVNANLKKLEVTFKAGTALRDVSETLEKQGLAMLNLGSVAYQSIAGALSTGNYWSPNMNYICISVQLICIHQFCL